MLLAPSCCAGLASRPPSALSAPRTCSARHSPRPTLLSVALHFWALFAFRSLFALSLLLPSSALLSVLSPLTWRHDTTTPPPPSSPGASGQRGQFASSSERPPRTRARPPPPLPCPHLAARTAHRMRSPRSRGARDARGCAARWGLRAAAVGGWIRGRSPPPKPRSAYIPNYGGDGFNRLKLGPSRVVLCATSLN